MLHLKITGKRARVLPGTLMIFQIMHCEAASSLRRPAAWDQFAYVSTDFRKKVVCKSQSELFLGF